MSAEDTRNKLPFENPAEWTAHLHWSGLLNEQHGLADSVREALSIPIDRLEDLVFRSRGVSVIDQAFTRVFGVLNAVAQRAVAEDQVLKRYRQAGVDVARIDEIRSLPLATILNALPPFASNYGMVAGVSGAVNGVLGPLGAVMSLPTLLLTALHAINLYGHHFGHDVYSAEERQFSLLVLTASVVARPTLRRTILRDMQQAACRLEVPARLSPFDKESQSILENVAEAMILRLLIGVLSRSWPGIGLVLGVGFSRAFVGHACQTALATYEQRWLLRRYGESALVSD